MYQDHALVLRLNPENQADWSFGLAVCQEEKQKIGDQQNLYRENWEPNSPQLGS